MAKNPLTYVVAIFLIALAATQCLFIVRQTETALVLQLGEPLPEVRKPGLHAKLPFVQNVVYFDARVLEYADLRASERQFFTVDQKAIKLDSYARWRIVEPLRFYTAMRSIDQALARIDDVVFSQLHAMVGTYTLTEVVSSHRAAIMKDVCEKVTALMRPFGIEVLDVRIKRMDFPEQNRSAIVERMRSDREREAKKYRSEGEEESTRIRSEADRQKAVILAEARRDAAVIRGNGDAEAAGIYARAFGKAPEFYSYQRWLEALQASFRDRSRIVISSEKPMLQQQR